MKILQVIDTLKVGGAEKIVVMISNILFENNIDVSILLIVKDGDLIESLNKNITVYRLERKNKFSFYKMKELSVYLSEFDIIHTHLKHNFRYTCIVAKLFNKKGGKIIFHNHSHNYKKSNIKYLKDFLFKNILKPKYYIGVNQEIYNWGKTYLKINTNNCFLLENCVPNEIINKSNFIKSGFVIVSNITRIKNLEFAIELAKAINKKLTIYGKIYDVDYFNELKSKIKIDNLIGKVIFINDCNNIQKELQKYDFGIHTSFKETGPLVLIEYLCQSLPFISFSTGNVFNKIGNDIPEFFIDKFEVEEWKYKINQLHLVTHKRIKEIYEKNYTIEKYFQECLMIYQNIQSY